MQTIPSLDPADDDFANTGRPAEDLFDDEIVRNPSPQKDDVVIPTGPKAQNNGRGRGAPRGRGRGRGVPRVRGGGRGGPAATSSAPATADWKGGDGAGSNIVSRFAPQKPAAAPAAPAAPAPVTQEVPPEGNDATEVAAATEEDEPVPSTSPKPDETEEKTPPSGPAAGTPRKEFPARNRITTGGPNRQKLSEEELASRMEAVRLKNQARTEKHLRAAEDEQKFNEAEQVRRVEEGKRRAEERKRQVEDGKKKKELDAEREQNRQRKLKALQNREWDVTKTEEDYNPSGYSSRSRRGAHGGVSGFISNPDAGYSREGGGEDAVEGDGERSFHSPRGRGRGGRGRRGDRGGGDRGGRGGHNPHHGQNQKQATPADVANEAEFPSLPASKPKVEIPEKTAETPLSPETPRGTWAEQAQDAAERAEKTETVVA
ncbi:hypothetical protein H072_9926 [Dactylellina haptotyla CBS 200.50]|uniref:Uncharacterized protein n=1 Tax=Dactylellina haptotyla (strain CBS 200.50) TaxID=1284197 RepID=S8BMU0_DACHA|nr:hypothetical protein H072_9926 [Dactylellina haptotyla CBS 200.50]